MQRSEGKLIGREEVKCQSLQVGRVTVQAKQRASWVRRGCVQAVGEEQSAADNLAGRGTI